mmetsp:Transcript_37952/g.114677  ORF Transcript_37952/g.114677 Transcript_37952/m.114677 type:complete len:235 (-) Transcript_37952:229-933(-)
MPHLPTVEGGKEGPQDAHAHEADDARDRARPGHVELAEIAPLDESAVPQLLKQQAFRVNGGQIAQEREVVAALPRGRRAKQRLGDGRVLTILARPQHGARLAAGRVARRHRPGRDAERAVGSLAARNRNVQVSELSAAAPAQSDGHLDWVRQLPEHRLAARGNLGGLGHLAARQPWRRRWHRQSGGIGRRGADQARRHADGCHRDLDGFGPLAARGAARLAFKHDGLGHVPAPQ